MHGVGAGAGFAGGPGALLPTALELHTQAAGRMLVAVVATIKHSLRVGTTPGAAG